MIELNKIEIRVIVLVLAAVLAVAVIRWKQADSARVELKVISEETAHVQR